jgi:hypothetical protein
MIVINAGLLSSASTWTVNVIHAVLAQDAARPTFRTFADTLQTVPRQERDCHLLFKSHHPHADFRLLAQARAAKFVITLRDPRDCVASLMQRFGRTFEQALVNTSSSLAHLDAVPAGDALVLRYEDRFFERSETIRAIAGFLEVGGCDQAFCERTAARFSIDEVTRLVACIPDMPTGSTTRYSDSIAHNETGFHTGHITDARSGKFAERLSADEISIIEAVTAHSASKFGYALDPGVLPGTLFRHDGDARASPKFHLAAGEWKARFVADEIFSCKIHANGSPVVSGRSGAALGFLVEAPSHAVELRINVEPTGTFHHAQLSRL